VELEQGRVTVNDVDLAYLAAGPGDGPLALCLHGFPDSAWTWRFLAPELVAAGFRVVAPFLRGYAPSAVPADGRFQSAALSLDALALHEALGGDPSAVLIGHDWGALAAYGAASGGPDRWRRVVAAAVPPALDLSRLFSYDQVKRSFYFFVFQWPMAEMIVGADDLAFLDGLWADWSPGYDGSEDVARVKECLRDPASLTAAIGYYRAALGAVPQDPALAELQAATNVPPPQPTLYLHGTDDGCMAVSLTEGTAEQLAPGSRVELVPGTGHFLHLERPDEVNRLIVDFLTAPEA
jgi:pimeloyl-ACP methyl ester carboxylesterase